jgi:hypothetical protein
MSELKELIDAREMDVNCWQCGWQGARTLSWLSNRRDMNCPQCSCVMVLCTSKVRSEITHQRRQLAALHGQMMKLLGEGSKTARRAQTPARSGGGARLTLALGEFSPRRAEPAPYSGRLR